MIIKPNNNNNFLALSYKHQIKKVVRFKNKISIFLKIHKISMKI
jgi:hypothetical protein